MFFDKNPGFKAFFIIKLKSIYLKQILQKNVKTEIKLILLKKKITASVKLNEILVSSVDIK